MQHVVYFDGHCSVCNWCIDYLLRHDKRGGLLYAPLQGSTARERLPAALVNDRSTVVLQTGTALETESTAAIKTIGLLGGVHTLMLGFLIVPRIVRDFVYRWFARHRYLFASRLKTCREPSAEEKLHFLP